MNKRIIVLLLVLLGIGGLAAVGIVPRLRHDEEAKQETQDEASRIPGVRTITAGQAKDTLGLTLPGRVEALRTTDLFARAQGYVQKWTADIGQKVRAGQVLAVITQPELNQDIAAAKTNLELARTNLDRLESVSLPGAISKAELDQARASYKSAQAALRRLQDLKGFQEITAPFDGVVTARNIEVGAYVTPGSTPLYSLNNDKSLRVFVDVPQSDRDGVQVEEGTAQILIPERAGKAIAGQIVRNAGAFDPATRTLTVQVDVPAGQGLLPGMYCQVGFAPKAPTAGSQITVPANAMYYSPQGPTVLVVNAEQKIEFRPISILKDFGTFVVIASGVKPGEQLVINPNSRLQEGSLVKVLPPEPEQPAGAKKG